MKKVIKQVVGIDVAQKELVVTLGKLYEDLSTDLLAYKVFKNTSNGFEALVLWVKKLTQEDVEVRYVMEATGVYHEKFAYFLSDLEKAISIILPPSQRSLQLRCFYISQSSTIISLFA